MDLFVLAQTCGTVGKVIIAYTAISVHQRVRKEHKIDDKVFKYMRKERKVAFLGIFLLLAEYTLHMMDRFL